MTGCEPIEGSGTNPPDVPACSKISLPPLPIGAAKVPSVVSSVHPRETVWPESVRLYYQPDLNVLSPCKLQLRKLEVVTLVALEDCAEKRSPRWDVAIVPVAMATASDASRSYWSRSQPGSSPSHSK
ncbi:hypothetical protein J6590_090272, partial [Homalodisca vitripennis]